MKVESTTDSVEAVLAASGLTQEAGKDKPSATPSDKKLEEVETTDESETSENEEPITKDGDQEDDEEESDSDKDDGKPKRKSGFQKRVNKLNRRLTDAQREVEYWKQEALKGKPQKDESSVKPEVTRIEAADKPKPDDFETNADYIEAVAEWKTEQKLAEREAKRKESEIKDDLDSKKKDFGRKFEAFSKDKDDVKDVLADADHIDMSLGIQDLLLDSDNGPELLYELAKNPEEYERINALPLAKMAVEFGKFQARLEKSSSSAKIETKKSSAPAPIKPVSSKSSNSIKAFEDMDLREYKRLREQGKI